MSVWKPFIYHFGVGALVMALGLTLLIRAKAVELKLAVERKWFIALIAGYVWLFILYLVWMLAALYIIPAPVGT